MRQCAECGAPAEDYEWDENRYLCDRHVAADTVGHACMGCGTVLRTVEDAVHWYIDNGGQLCPECLDRPGRAPSHL